MRWIRGMAPLAAIAFLGAGAVARPPLLQAATAAWEPPPCADGGPPGFAGTAWYRLDGFVDASGTLASQRLTVGVIGGAERFLDLPPESFATGPSNGVVLVGADDGTRSRLALLDVRRGCETLVATERAVVRSALLAPDGASVVEHRVDRRTRADLGVWRRALAGGSAVRLVPGIGADRRYGPTFSTELRWAADGRLAVTSCGELACRTRLVHIASGRSMTLGPTGPVIGVADDGVVAYGVCPGSPCAVLQFRGAGGMRLLAPAAGRAAMTGADLVFETAAGGLTAIELATGRTRVIEGGSGLVPLRDGSGATAGVDARPGTVLLARGGRLDGRAGAIVADGDRVARPIPAVQR